MPITTIPLRPSLATQAKRALHDLALSLDCVLQRYLRVRQAQSSARVLGQLDERVLRDLGLHRSELLSAAAELHERQRRRGLFAALQPR